MRSLERFSRFFRSLGGQMTLWNTGLVFGVVVVAIVGIREGLSQALLREIDNSLIEEMDELALAIQAYQFDRPQVQAALTRAAEAREASGWYFRWLDSDRKTTLWASPLAPELSPHHASLVESDNAVLATATHRSIERRLVRLDPALFASTYLRIGVATRAADHEVWLMTRVAAVVGFAAALLAPFGALLIARQAIAPLNTMIRMTEQLRPTRLEERLANRGVDDELDQLADRVNHFLDQINVHLQANRDFVANAAHELRSPLTAMLSSLDVSLDSPRSADEYRDLLSHLQDQCQHLRQLVNQLMQLAENEAGIPLDAKRSVRLDDVIRRTLEMFDAVAEDAGIRLSGTLETEGLVIGEPGRLRQLLTNLVDNAIKFTPRGGTIDVSLHEDEAANQVVVTVKDTGSGIPAESLPRIFDRFYQVDPARSRGNQRRGSGLGLSICKAIAVAHHGTIRAESPPSSGAAFTICMPRAAAVAE